MTGAIRQKGDLVQLQVGLCISSGHIAFCISTHWALYWTVWMLLSFCRLPCYTSEHELCGLTLNPSRIQVQHSVFSHLRGWRRFCCQILHSKKGKHCPDCMRQVHPSQPKTQSLSLLTGSSCPSCLDSLYNRTTRSGWNLSLLRSRPEWFFPGWTAGLLPLYRPVVSGRSNEDSGSCFSWSALPQWGVASTPAGDCPWTSSCPCCLDCGTWRALRHNDVLWGDWTP